MANSNPTLYINFDEVEELADNPLRDEISRYVQPVLRFYPQTGFELHLNDGDKHYQVIDKDAQPIRYRVIEQAIDALIDIPGLSPQMIIDLTAITKSNQ
jgi:hypothetical protein